MAKKKKRAKKTKSSILVSAGPFNLFAVSLALAVFGQMIIYNGGRIAPGIILFAAAALFFALADRVSAGSRDKEKTDIKFEISMLILMVFTALIFRTYLISDVPAGCYRDEGQNGLEAINIMNSIMLEGTTLPVYIERWTQNAALYMYFIAVSFKAFGIGVIQIRLVSIVFGVLCVPAFYFLARSMFGPRIAVIGGFLIAVTRWHVNFSRIGFLGIVTVFFVIIAAYFAYRAYKERKLSDFVLMGVVASFSLYSYIAARLIPVGLFIFFFIYFTAQLIKNRKHLKKNIKQLLKGHAGLNYIIPGLIGVFALLAFAADSAAAARPLFPNLGIFKLTSKTAALFFKLMTAGTVMYYIFIKFFKPKTPAGYAAPAVGMVLAVLAYTAHGAVPAMVLFLLALAAGVFTLFHFGYAENGYLKKIFMSVYFFIVVFAPLGNYVLQHPENFMSRAATVSIFNREMLREIGGRYVDENTGKPKHWTKLYSDNIKNTILMYNYKGDGNPRHNYHTVPMLDKGTGIFVALGFLFLLLRIYRPLPLFLLAMYFSLLQAGLFSTESPQGYRTIGVIPVVLLFGLYAASKGMEYFREQYGKKLVPVLFGIMLAGTAYIGYLNYDGYFNKFTKNPGSWAEFSTDEYSMGKYVKSLGDDWVAVVRPDWADSYTFRFAAYPLKNYERFSPSEWIPVKENRLGGVKNCAFVLDQAYLPLLDVLKSMYPNGKYHDFRHKFFTERLLYWVYEVPYSDIKKQQEKPHKNGLVGYYYFDNIQKSDRKEAVKHSNHWRGKPRFERLDPFILFNWTQDPILGPFSVEWKGKIKINKPGTYVFQTKSNDYSDVYIDGKKILVNPGGGGGLAAKSEKIYLEKGFHKIMVRYYESVHYSKMQFWWQPPGTVKMEVVPSEVLYP